VAYQVQDLQQNWAEPLHEYGQFSEIIKRLLQYRHQKHAQYEQTLDTLETKRDSLEDLERNEAEARRLQEALAAAGVPSALSRSKSSAVASRSPPANLNRNRSNSEPVAALEAEQAAGGVSPGFSSPEHVDAALDKEEDEYGQRERDYESSNGAPERLPPAPVTMPKRNKGLGSGLISALSHSIHGMMDVDPEAARRSNISKTRDTISQVRSS
jgi:sorting nexin-41/42